MIAVDTQILVYAHRNDCEFHSRAFDVLSELVNGPNPWSIPWPCVHEFIGIVTKRGLFSQPSTIQDAFLAIGRMQESQGLVFLGEGQNHLETLQEISKRGKISGPMIHDARIAAICIAHNVETLYSCDRDFSRFPKLKVKNPL